MVNFKEIVQKMVRERDSMQAEIDKLDQAISALQSLAGNSSVAPRKKPGMSAQARRRISQAQKKRWAKTKQANNAAGNSGKTKPKISAQGLRNIVEGQRRRWAKVRATAKGKAAATKK